MGTVWFPKATMDQDSSKAIPWADFTARMEPGRQGQTGGTRALTSPQILLLEHDLWVMLRTCHLHKTSHFLKIACKYIIFCTRTATLSEYHNVVVLEQPRPKTRFLKIFTSIAYIPEIFQIPSGQKFPGPLMVMTGWHSHTFSNLFVFCRHFCKPNHWVYEHPQRDFLPRQALRGVQGVTQGMDHHNIPA